MMNENQLLAEAIKIATEAHHGQQDRFGAPYILHPLRVMARLGSTGEKIVGVLHDVVEDPPWTLEALSKRAFPQHLLEALQAVTKEEGEDYEQFVRRSATNPLARRVKLADLEDNMDLRRMPEVSANDLPRLQKYVKAWRFLTEYPG